MYFWRIFSFFSFAVCGSIFFFLLTRLVPCSARAYFNNSCVCVEGSKFARFVPFPPLRQRASARDRVGMVGPNWGVGPLRAKPSKRVLNVRHVVHGALSQR